MRPVNFNAILTLDMRSLAFMRIGIAITLLVDLTIRFSDLEAHYTDNGVLPIEGLFRYWWNAYHYSLHTMSNLWILQSLLFLINFFCICSLLIGYHTRISTFLCWFFLLSLHNRNPFITQGGDDLLRLILFLCLFLPWGYYYSFDAIKQIQTPDKPKNYTSIAGLAYILQIIYVYFFSALLKNSPEWTTEYTALYYALSLDQILFPLGKLLYPYENFLKIITAIVYYIELVFPFILLSPFWTSYCRVLFIGVLCLMHVGISLCLNVGLFPLISIVCMIGLLPSNYTDKIVRQLDKVENLKELPAFLSKEIIQPMKIKIPKESFLVSFCLMLIGIYILLWNIETTGKRTFISHARINWIGDLLRVDQQWGMFAPAVFKDDGWFIFAAKNKDAHEIDILQQGKKVSYDKPAYIAGMFKNDRWRKFHENILMITNSNLRPFYCSFLLNQWNKKNEADKIYQLKIIYMKEISLPDYKVKNPTVELLCNCELK